MGGEQNRQRDSSLRGGASRGTGCEEKRAATASQNDAGLQRAAMLCVSVLLLLEHYFCGFDYDGYRVANLEFHFVGAALGNDALDDVFADADDDVGHDAARFDFGHFTFQPV